MNNDEQPTSRPPYPAMTPQQQDTVGRAKRTLWLGLCFIVGAGLVIAIFLVF